MKRLWRILIIHPIKDLLCFKSFFLLIFIVALADRGVKYIKTLYQLNLKLPRFWRLDPTFSADMLFQMPGLILKQMGINHLFLTIAGLFLVRQLVLLWPSSDLRRMHRKEREPFGIIASLKSIGWKPVLFHVTGLTTLWVAACIWGLCWFWINRLFWHYCRSSLWLWMLAINIIAIIPLMSAAFSYSSRLAVNSTGRFTEKLGLLYKLFTDWRIGIGSWLFFALRFIIEAIFVVVVPIYILMAIEKGALKLLLLTLLATPVAAYLEMVSFKIFLALFIDFPLVRQEYDRYYESEAV